MWYCFCIVVFWNVVEFCGEEGWVDDVELGVDGGEVEVNCVVLVDVVGGEDGYGY